MNIIKINVITNFKNEFYSSIALQSKKILSMDLTSIEKYGKEMQIEFKFINYVDIDFSSDSYKDQLFLYTSSEDPGLLYKSYIEDILLGLESQGAILIPGFNFFRAHHNKVYMEILRNILLKDIDTGISSKSFGTLEDFLKRKNDFEAPAVIKNAEGAGSKGVALIKDSSALVNLPSKISNSFNFKLFVKQLIGRWQPFSMNRKKFVIQNFIPNLNCDYKVLVFGSKYYILKRSIKKNDFRASGSGSFDLEPKTPNGLFDFSEIIFQKLKVPILSLDIAYDGLKFYLIEFQAINFGTVTLEESSRYFYKKNNEWHIAEEKSILEQEFVRSVSEFLQKH